MLKLDWRIKFVQVAAACDLFLPLNAPIIANIIKAKQLANPNALK